MIERISNLFDEEYLLKHTNKDEDIDDGRRVFYTLTDDPDNPGPKEMDFTPTWRTQHRSAKMLGLLCDLLVEKGIITEEDLDDLLLHVIR